MEKEMTRLEGAKELLQDLGESFLNGVSLKIEANDFNLVSWLIEQHEKQLNEIAHLKETVRVYKISDEWVREQSKKVKHIFPLETTAGYGQLCDKVVEQQKEIKRLEDFTENLQVVHFVEVQREKATVERYEKALIDIASYHRDTEIYSSITGIAKQALELNKQ